MSRVGVMPKKAPYLAKGPAPQHGSEVGTGSECSLLE
jgi:hypothetical protein